jgi:glycosyltransferase A (GT-A) superfamily protein (DUF2064 family)
MRRQLLLIAKAPVPGRVKTRLCPPCTPEQAARVAAAALADTIAVLTATPAGRRTIVLSGRYRRPPGWHLVLQEGDGLAHRLSNAFVDTALPGTASVLVGMDTPQLTPARLDALTNGLQESGAVLGPAEDGGWWGLALRDPSHATALRDVPMSTPDTAQWTVKALRERGVRIGYGPVLRDVDTAADAWTVSAGCAGTFPAAVAENVPRPVSR